MIGSPSPWLILSGVFQHADILSDVLQKTCKGRVKQVENPFVNFGIANVSYSFYACVFSRLVSGEVSEMVEVVVYIFVLSMQQGQRWHSLRQQKS